MRSVLFILFFALFSTSLFSQPVFKNPGVPASFRYNILDHVDTFKKPMIATISIKSNEQNGLKTYHISANEGGKFSNEIELNAMDLTTISEKRINLSNNVLEESFTHLGNKITFYNRSKNIKKETQTNDHNIYSRYAYFFSFQGFPFVIGRSVSFKSYMFEYGDALTMKVSCVAKQNIKVRAGSFDCYKLELGVGGWQSFFSTDYFYLYFTVAAPHFFVKYEEPQHDGSYIVNELISIEK